ncbi:MAG: hypothetical protein F4X21_01035 [Acidimicrobiia bacterium]|nr:hypothetical protein [Acidimicrobiia bacterium]
MTDGTHLPGLEGNNPLGFFAALGVQVVFDEEEQRPRLWWTNDIVPHAVVDDEFDTEKIVNSTMSLIRRMLDSPTLNPSTGTKADNTAKFDPEHIRPYLESTKDVDIDVRLASALVAERSLDGSGKKAKPTDLYFTAGKMNFLEIARDLMEQVTCDHLVEAINGPWRYSSTMSSLLWDVADDRIYALAPINPANDKKLTNPGAEALALLGLSRHPVFAGRDNRGRDRTLTSGCEGPWRSNNTYTWPIWTQPASGQAVRSLLAQVKGKVSANENRVAWYRGWGVSMVMTSEIQRSDQGGYGTFRPPQITWNESN